MDTFVGWEAGYRMLKTVVYDKFYQSGWMRYFRI